MPCPILRGSAASAQGNEVGDLAMGLLGEFVETTAYTPEGKLDIPSMLKNTRKYLREGRENICEAADTYSSLRGKEEGERLRLRESLLKYCGLDTLAMVLLWQRLREFCACEAV